MRGVAGDLAGNLVLPDAANLADTDQPWPFVVVLEPANVGRYQSRTGLDPAIIRVHRGVSIARLTVGIVEKHDDIRFQRALIALQRQGVVAALLDYPSGDGTLPLSASAVTSDPLSESI